MREGTVKFFNTVQGFGFIAQSKGGPDIFFHKSGMLDEVQKNDKVSYEVQSGPKGPTAVNVKRI